MIIDYEDLQTHNYLFKSKHLIGNYLVYLECRNTFFIPLGVFSILHINLILEQTAMAGTRWNSTVWEKSSSKLFLYSEIKP